MRAVIVFAAAACGLLMLSVQEVEAQTVAPSAAPPTSSAGGSGLLTVFLRHDQAKTLGQINEELRRNGYFEQFPPPGIEVVSWYIAMGIGQIVTLRVPPERLREVNVVLERTAWGAYRTDFYPSYDYQQLYEQQRQAQRAQAQPDQRR
jgi:hypothetical protein